MTAGATNLLSRNTNNQHTASVGPATVTAPHLQYQMHLPQLLHTSALTYGKKQKKKGGKSKEASLDSLLEEMSDDEDLSDQDEAIVANTPAAKFIEDHQKHGSGKKKADSKGIKYIYFNLMCKKQYKMLCRWEDEGQERAPVRRDLLRGAQGDGRGVVLARVGRGAGADEGVLRQATDSSLVHGPGRPARGAGGRHLPAERSGLPVQEGSQARHRRLHLIPAGHQEHCRRHQGLGDESQPPARRDKVSLLIFLP